MQIIDLQPFGQRYESSFACFDLLVMYQSETLIDHVQVHVLHLPMPVPPKGARRGMGYSPFSRAKRLRWLPRRGSNRRFVRPRMPPLRGPLWAKASGQLRFVFARIQIFGTCKSGKSEMSAKRRRCKDLHPNKSSICTPYKSSVPKVRIKLCLLRFVRQRYEVKLCLLRFVPHKGKAK